MIESDQTPRSTSEEYQVLLASRRASLRDQLKRILVGSVDFVCEIGSGHGHFLTAYAQTHPGEVCIGVDIIRERVERAIRKRDRSRLGHLHFLHAEARLFLENIPAEASISKVFILFPDPWPKTRHHKHRILQVDFLTLLRARVRSDAQLYFRTDHRPYFDDAHAAVSQHAGWRLTDTPWPFDHGTVFQERAATHSSFVAEPRH